MGQVVFVLYAVLLGAGKYVILLKDIPAYAKTIIAMETLYCIGTSTFKFSTLLLFLASSARFHASPPYSSVLPPSSLPTTSPKSSFPYSSAHR